MANYYHEARAQVRGMKKHEESNRRRAERRAELATARVRFRSRNTQKQSFGCDVRLHTKEAANWARHC
jgi:hypothetical protein